MICSICGGHVTWRGPLIALTHAECASCGAINSQISEDDFSEDDSDAYSEDQTSSGKD